MVEVPQIQCRALSRTWQGAGGRHHALDAIDFTVQAGDYIAIEGPSGAGKSTLLRILGGLDRQYEGELKLFGKDVRTLRDTALSRLRNEKVASIFQSYQLLPHLTVEENILLPFTWRASSAPRSELRHDARRTLDDLGIADKLNDFPDTLSGGQQQRVAIARALITKPSLLLCDEITGNLDADYASYVMSLLENVRRATGLTIVIVSHDPLILQRADRRYVLSEGKLLLRHEPGASA